MGKGTTVNDIADHLGISTSTVSRVLNSSQLVKSETRKRIESAALEMGYEKRRTKRHAPRSILVVALFLPRSPDVYHRLFYDTAELLAGLTEGFQEVRTQISVSVNKPNPDLFASKKSGNIDACVFGFTVPSDAVRQLLQERYIPSVLLNRESASLSFVSTDHYTGMRALLRRAASARKVLKPCYISFNPARTVAELREEAFLAACRSEGVEWTEADLVRIDTVEQISKEMVRELSRKYNTVFCFNDFVAVYFYQVALSVHISIPEQLGIAGYDDSPVRQLTPQKIDTVSLSPFRLGEEAGKWLKRTIIDRETGRLQLRIPGNLICGETLCAAGEFDTQTKKMKKPLT